MRYEATPFPISIRERARLSDSTGRKTLELAELGKAEFYLTFGPGPDTTEYGELNLERLFHWNMKIGTEPVLAFPTVEEPWVDPSYSSTGKEWEPAVEFSNYPLGMGD